MRIEVEVFKEVDGVDMVIRFFEVELLCGKRHRGLHGSHNSPLFIGLPVANIAASVCFAKRRAKNFIYIMGFHRGIPPVRLPLNLLSHSRRTVQQALILPRE